ncbi:MAG: YkgJ family cysteine cluster protein [Ferruginibacter sp.]|nr:YkgJ family cysteine cluster protein [Ferruginibacter sp.]
MEDIIIDRNFIAQQAIDKLDENDAFRSYLQKIDSAELDEKVHAINNVITPQIDCTVCGACCRQLMINVTEEEKVKVAAHLKITPTEFQQKYLEESMQGKLIMGSIPCHFLADSKCTVYENRFTGCRAFPHLHEANFKGRLFGTLVHYAMCPIIYNVVEELKVEVGFKE